MKQNLTAFMVGILFGTGLILSGMTQPANVIGFLDFFGDWNPTLMFVMIGAIGLHAISYRWIKHRQSPLFAAEFHLPTKKDLDWTLIGGASVFGFGWGLAGYCPGPAMTSALSFQTDIALFIAFTVVGMLSHHAIQKKVAGQFAKQAFPQQNTSEPSGQPLSAK